MLCTTSEKQTHAPPCLHSLAHVV
jgi:hypothetical protein